MNDDWIRAGSVKEAGSSINWLRAMIAIVGVALLIVGIGIWVPSARENTARCLASFAYEHNYSVEGLMRNPALQNTLIEATTLCSQ